MQPKIGLNTDNISGMVLHAHENPSLSSIKFTSSKQLEKTTRVELGAESTLKADTRNGSNTKRPQAPSRHRSTKQSKVASLQQQVPEIIVPEGSIIEYS